MVGPVGFELAARVALEVAPVRLGRFRPRLASAQPPDLGELFAAKIRQLRKFTALDLDLLMAVIAVCLAPAVHPIAADIILTALAVWAMRNSR